MYVHYVSIFLKLIKDAKIYLKYNIYGLCECRRFSENIFLK